MQWYVLVNETLSCDVPSAPSMRPSPLTTSILGDGRVCDLTRHGCTYTDAHCWMLPKRGLLISGCCSTRRTRACSHAPMPSDTTLTRASFTPVTYRLVLRSASDYGLQAIFSLTTMSRPRIRPARSSNTEADARFEASITEVVDLSGGQVQRY